MTGSDWRTTMWLYPWDADDEGVDNVLATIQNRAGIDAVALAVAYHSGMFLLPHNPRHKLYFPTPGVYFQPDQSRFERLMMRPQVNDLAGSGIVESVRRESAVRRMRLDAWVVILHNTGLGTAYPSATNVNAFDDRHLPHLCPANPDVRAYVTALIGDLAARDFDGILVESLEYMPYQHGYHHEIAGLPLTPYASYLLGLCFCEHCLAAAESAGADAMAVHAFVRDDLEAFFAGAIDRGRPDIRWSGIRELASGELGAYHDARIQVVTSLFAEVRSTWPSGGPTLELCDFAPLWPLGWDGTALSSGLDLQAVAPYVDAAWPCPYFTSLETVRTKTAEYRQKAPDEWPVRPIMRAIPPQTLSAEGLSEQMLACDPSSIAGYGFYNYGFMRMSTLDWIRSGLEAAGAKQNP